jgi:hypothetical protein
MPKLTKHFIDTEIEYPSKGYRTRNSKRFDAYSKLVSLKGKLKEASSWRTFEAVPADANETVYTTQKDLLDQEES